MKIALFIMSLLLMLVAVDAVWGQAIVCDGQTGGGSGVVSWDSQLRDYVYRVTGGAVPQNPDSIFIGTHDPDLSHYSAICMPPGWTYEIISDSRPDHSNPTNHGMVSPPADGNCLYIFLFRNESGAPLSSSTPTDFGFDYYGYPHNVDWTVAAFPPVSADWAAHVGTGAGPVHGPRCDTLCEYGVPTPYHYLAGKKDNFTRVDGAEPSSPSAALLALMQTLSGGADPNFDSPATDRCFGHTFTGWDASGCIVGAELCFRITPISSGCTNDFFSIRGEDPVDATWGPYIKYLKAWDSGDPADTFWTVGDTLDICLDLANMPLIKRGEVYIMPPNILAALDDGDMDILLADDTKIDFLELTVEVCIDTCYATGDVNGDGISLTGADLSALIDFVNNGILPAGPLWQCDLNGDSYVDQLDIDMYECYFISGLSCFPVYPVPTDCDPDTIRGACFEVDSCTVKSAYNCADVGGTYQGDGTICLAPLGACCWPDGSCTQVYLAMEECADLGGRWMGHVPCTPNPCRCMKVPKGLVAWWSLDEAYPPIANDLAALGPYKAYDVGLFHVPTRYWPGMVRTAYLYDWNNHGISRTAYDPFVAIGTDDFTIDAWIKSEPVTGSIYRLVRPIVSNEISVPFGDVSNPGTGMAFLLQQDDFTPPDQYRLWLRMWVNGVPQDFYSDWFPLNSDYHHVAIEVLRNNSNPYLKVVLFYLDGYTITARFDPLLYGGKLHNSSPPHALDIGHLTPDSPTNLLSPGYFTYNFYFSGYLDEVQIFKGGIRRENDIEAIWLARELGKCLDFCYVAPIVIMNTNQTYPTQSIVVVNNGPTQIYAWQIFGTDITPLFGSVSAGPAIPGLVQVTVSPTTPLPAGQCRQFIAEFTDPSGGIFECYGYICSPAEITKPPDTKAGSLSEGTIRPYDVADLYIGDSVNIEFSVYNMADADGVFDYEIAVQNSCDCNEVDSIISLDDQPVGASIIGSLNLPLGNTAIISVKAKLVNFESFTIQSVALIADYNGDGEPIPGLSVGIRPIFLPDCNLNGIHDSIDIETGFSPDTNSNTIPDECEVYGMASQCPVPGDANNDSTVNVGDAVYMINYVFKGGPPPAVLPEADANGDCTLNVGDAVYLINYVFKGGDDPICNEECVWD